MHRLFVTLFRSASIASVECAKSVRTVFSVLDFNKKSATVFSMNPNYRFNPAQMAKDTSDAYSADGYTSWNSVCLLLAQRGFNSYEAEAILRSKWTRWARDAWNKKTKPTATALANFLDNGNITPRCSQVNELVMETFGDELGLEANEQGVPCQRGNVVVGNATILVPLGTPNCCNPCTETYWSM